MKRCPECGRDYNDDSLSFCLDDGQELLFGPSSLGGRSDNESQTAIFHPTDAPSEAATRAHINTTNESAILRSSEERKIKVKVALGLFALAGLILTGLGYGLYQIAKNPDHTNPSSTALKTRRLTGDGKTRQAVISPDGKFLAYQTDKALRVKQIETNSEVEVISPNEFPGGMGSLVFSPDGNFVYFAGEKEGNTEPNIYRTPTLGGRIEKVISNGWGLSFSPGGKQITFARGNADGVEQSYYTANADGTQEKMVISLKDSSIFFAASPSWSPDGKFLAAGIGDDSLLPKPKFIPIIVSISDGTYKKLGEKYFALWEVIRWHPDGQTLYFIGSESSDSRQIWEFQYPSGSSRAVTQPINNYGGISITADGKSLATVEFKTTSSIWVSSDTDPKNAKLVMPDRFDTWGFAWTPDGKIVYVSDQSGDREVWIMDKTGENAKQLTNDRKFKRDPAVSSDGRLIAYSGPGQSLYQMSIDGGNLVQLPELVGSPSFSPDSKWIIYDFWVSPHGYSIFRMPTGGGTPERLTDYVAQWAKYSPDGKYFACRLSDDKAQSWDRIAIVPAEGGDPVKIIQLPPNSGGLTRWTPDGNGLTYFNNGLWIQPIDGGAPKKLEIPKYRSTGLSRLEFSPDGKQVGIVLVETTSNAVLITDFR